MTSKRSVIGAAAAVSVALAVAASPALATDSTAVAKGKKNPVKISAPPTATQWTKFTITCMAPVAAAGGKLHLYQNGDIIPLKKATVNSAGACSFWVKSGLVGTNNFDLAITKGSKTYQSNAITVQVKAKAGA